MFTRSKYDEKQRANIKKRVPSNRWSLGAGTISRAYEIESWNYIRQKDYQLHFLQKADTQTNARPQIPATEFQRLAYYQCYAVTPFKVLIVFLHQYHFGMFTWLHIANALFRNLPCNYIHMFLAKYNPNEHLFGSKMIPLCYGVSWQVVLCGILQLVASADILALFMHYSFTGLYHHDPWNKCTNKWNNVTPIPKPYRCYTLNEFLNVTAQYQYDGADEKTRFTFKTNSYMFPNGTLFTISPLSYFLKSWIKLNLLKHFSVQFVVIFTLIWILAALFYKQVFKKYVWKLIFGLQLVKYAISCYCILYIYYKYLEQKLDTISSQFKGEAYLKLVKRWDLEFYADAISGPPIVHLLTSRSTDEVDPARDSFIMTVSNSLAYFFNAFVYDRLKDFTESDLNSAVYLSRFNPYPIFYTWPIFFNSAVSTFMSRIFYTMTLILEFIVFTVTYQILVEVVACEWRWTRRWMATILISITGLALSMTLEYRTKLLLYIFTTGITGLTEAVVVCWLYPLHRLMDDMHFHKGTTVTTWRKWSLRMLPWYYIYKIYKSFRGLVRVTDKRVHKHAIHRDWSATKWAWAVGILPLPLGVLFAIFRHVIILRQGWRKLLKPRADWGPPEQVARHLRKQFDSREYMGSQSLRFLCRHLMTKAQTASYRLDVRYHEVDGRQSTIDHDIRGKADRKSVYRRRTEI